MKLMTRAAVVALATLAFTVGCGSSDKAPTTPTGNGLVTHTFTYVRPTSAPTVTAVNLVGSFNAWNTTAKAMTQQTDGSWKTTLDLAPGTYQYKYFMNGSTWPNNMCNDPTWGDPNHGGKIDLTVTTCSDDGNGGQNGVLTIQ